MIARLPGPMLSVAVDQVSQVDSEDALGGLWTVFTKAKDSLEQGRRLENIAWRLWYRHLSAPPHHPSSEASGSGSEDAGAPLSSTPPLEHLSSSESEREDEGWEDETTVGDSDGEEAPEGAVRAPSTSQLVPAAGRPRRQIVGRISRSASPVRTAGTPLPPLASSHPQSSKRPGMTSRSHSSPPTRSPINVGKFISSLLPERAIPERRATGIQPVASTSTCPALPAHSPRSRSPARALSRRASHEDTRAGLAPSSRVPATPVTGSSAGGATLSQNAKPSRLPQAPSLVLTKPTPKPTPITTPGTEDEDAEEKRTLVAPSFPPLSTRPQQQLTPRTQKKFEFVPLQEVTMNGHGHGGHNVADGSTGQPPPNDKEKEVAFEQKKEECNPETCKESNKRSKIFFIQSPGRDEGSSFSDSHASPDSDENASVEAQQNQASKNAAQPALAQQQQPQRAPEQPDTPSPAPRPAGPVRTKSKRQIYAGPQPNRGGKYPSAKTRVLGAGYVRPTAAPQPPVLAQRTSSEKKLQAAPQPKRADSLPMPLQQKEQKETVPTKDHALTVETRVQAPAPKPVVPPGVGSPQVTRRREREPEPAPAVRGLPSSSPAVLKAPPPTPASVMSSRPPPAISPSRLRVPPPTPVTVMARNLPPTPPPNTVQVKPQMTRPQQPHHTHKSPPPPSEVDEVEDDDDSEWYSSDAETDAEDADAEAEAAKQAELQRAAEEARRQRDMFAKKRTPSRVELVELGRIGGGLSRLFHPDPELLKSADLYRTQSADDTMARRAAADRLKANKSAVELRPNAEGPAAARPQTKKSVAPLKLRKSTAALPTVQNESVKAGESATGSTRGWILRGKPEDEDESDDDETEDPDLGMSKSAAQQRLEAFVSRRNSRTGSSSRRLTPPTPLRTSVEAPQPEEPARPTSTRPSPTRSEGHQVSFAPVQTTEPESMPPAQPIDFVPPPHPYNQQIAQQNTPRTAARIMMADELSESVRRQLLWMRASRATGFPNNLPRVQSQDDVVRNPPRPTRGPADEVRGSAPQPRHRPAPLQQQPVVDTRRRSAIAGLRPLTPLQRDEQRQANALQRTRSLAEGLAHHDYHIAGW